MLAVKHALSSKFRYVTINGYFELKNELNLI